MLVAHWQTTATGPVVELLDFRLWIAAWDCLLCFACRSWEGLERENILLDLLCLMWWDCFVCNNFDAAAVGLVNTTYLLAPVIADDGGRHDPCDNGTYCLATFSFWGSGPSVQCWPSFCYGICQN
jgi:hypothetical protein